ncbi:MAG: hypothetical protein JJE21_03665 [Spirochaetaceae bacterium]|nr:hypothetical protein [Spirochaetaceae bacterium]
MKNKFEKWLMDFKRTHNGNDELGLVLLIISLALNLVSALVGIPIIMAVIQAGSLLCFGGSIFRFFSKNKSIRATENYKLTHIKDTISQYIKDQKFYLKESKTHKFYSCPDCGTVCRVPKGKGKIKIKCPNCGKSFVKKT